MVKINSTIFRTIKDEATGATKSIGLFGKSFTELKNILNSIKTKGLLKANVVSDKDIQCIKRYNFEIENGATHQQAMEQATKGASSATKQMIKNANGNTIALDKMTVGAKAASIATNALSIALNALVMAGVGIALNAIISEFSSVVNAYEEGIEKLENLDSEIKSLETKQKELNDELATTKLRIQELEGMEKLSLFDQAYKDNGFEKRLN